jgi:hypothetical protein
MWYARVAMIGLGLMWCATCARHRPPAIQEGQELSIPPGLDSVQTQRWIAERRAECAGRLMLLVDYKVFAVKCQLGSASARNPPNER